MRDTYYAETLALNQVKDICSRNRAEFLELPGRIDNGVDGIIVVTSKYSKNVIGCIHVQLKGGDSYDKSGTLNLPSNTVKRYKEIAKSISEPYILVYSKNNKKTYWVDLKDEKTYYQTDRGNWKIKLDKTQEFKSRTFMDIQKQISKSYELYDLESVKIKNTANNAHLFRNDSLKTACRKLFNSFKTEDFFVRIGKSKKKVIFSRVAWNHITRNNRKVSRKVQSLMLLSVIPDIIRSNTQLRKVSCQKVERNHEIYLMEKYVMEVECVFNYRFPAIINLVFLRKKVLDNRGKDMVWFYSIYESNRSRTLKGKKED